MPILHIFWSIFLIFLLAAWIWTLISVVSDISPPRISTAPARAFGSWP